MYCPSKAVSFKRSLLNGKERRFSANFAVPHPVRTPPCSLVDNSEINFQCGMKIHQDFAITAKCASFFFHLWQWRNGHRCPLTNSGETTLEQVPKAQNIDKRMMMIKKVSQRYWEQIPNFFMPPLQIFVWGKKKPQPDLCASLEIRFPIANCYTRWRCDSHTMGTGEIRWKSPRLSL